jgi:predicted PurR-regulated permease PerM
MTIPESKPPDDGGSDDWATRSHVQTLVMMVATALGFFLCYRLAVPFLSPLTWAVTLAILFAPFHRRIESRIRHPGVATAVSVLVIGLIVVVPMTLVGQQLLMQAAKGAEVIEAKMASGAWRRVLADNDAVAPWVERLAGQMDLPGMVRTFSSWLITRAGALVTGSVFQAVDFLLTFYLLFFFLRDRRAGLATLRHLSPLKVAEMDLLARRVGDTVHATVYGTLLVSAVQGVLGGLMFWWLGLPAPMLWGVVMALLALVPVLGAFVIWLPAALFLLLDGSWGKALILSAWGFMIVGTVDNLLRPVLVGNRLRIHTVPVFLSVVGGLIQFGASGLVLGPVVLAVTTVLLEIWAGRMPVLPLDSQGD